MDTQEALDKVIDDIISMLKQTTHIYIIGDGGLAAQSDHLACDLLKGAKLPAISLCSNASLMSAVGNDISFTESYLIQLKALMHPTDVLFVMSTSGESPNLVDAASYAFHMGADVISLIGRYTCSLRSWSTISAILGDGRYSGREFTARAEDAIASFCHSIYLRLIKE